MQKFEYRIEHITLKDHPAKDREFVEILNRFGREGWRVGNYHADPQISVNEVTVTLLLERAV